MLHATHQTAGIDFAIAIVNGTSLGNAVANGFEPGSLAVLRRSRKAKPPSRNQNP